MVNGNGSISFNTITVFKNIMIVYINENTLEVIVSLINSCIFKKS